MFIFDAILSVSAGIAFQGKNFGFVSLPVRVVIGSLECDSPSWVNDREIRCTTALDVVGPKNVSIWAANRSTPVRLYTFQNAITPVCAYGYYGTNGLLCAKCPDGALCPGGETTDDRVTSLSGYWRVTILSQLTDAVCPSQRQGDALPYCVYTVACAPKESCQGSNVCATGYTGDRCATCDNGYFRTNGNCAECPSSPYAIIVVFVVLGMSRARISFSTISCIFPFRCSSGRARHLLLPEQERHFADAHLCWHRLRAGYLDLRPGEDSLA